MLFNLFKRNREPSPPPKVGRSRTVSAALGSRSGALPHGIFEMPVPMDGFRFTGRNRADFYRYMRDRIPIISSAVWTWVHLCSTQQERELSGDEREIERAAVILDRLDRRIFPRDDGDTRGLRRLTENFFLDLFTLGRFSARVHLLPDGGGISRLEVFDPAHVHWAKDRNGRQRPWLEREPGEFEPIRPETFFHRTLVTDIASPDGPEPLACIPFVAEIEQRMLEDMARASHNAGTPRLQVRITPPERHPGEDPDTYSSRANSYFESTVRQFDELGPDDNLFTWSDVEVRVIGGTSGEGQTWKVNREQVIEDVITGMKLFPWTLGRSHGTTKNWIFAQYNLLMQIVDSIQMLGRDLAEWLMNLELRLTGNLASARWTFAPNQDPFIVERNRARNMHFERIDNMVRRGYISKDQGARELGYPEAYRADRREEENRC